MSRRNKMIEKIAASLVCAIIVLASTVVYAVSSSAAHSILIDRRAIAKTPRHLGLNVEVKDHYEKANIWDWIADSGATVVREFTPERNLKVGMVSDEDLKGPHMERNWRVLNLAKVGEEEFASIQSRNDFDAWRKDILTNPQKKIPWELFSFDRELPWLGNPDGIVSKLKEIGIEPALPLDYSTKIFPRPLVKKWVVEGIPGDEVIDWGAAACAYEYYFALIYHFSSEFGTRYFTMHNEPEYLTKWFHMPSDNNKFTKSDALQRNLFVTPQEFGHRALSTQLSVLGRMAKLAIEDVRSILKDKTLAKKLFLSGYPAHNQAERYWKQSEPYFDSMDFHHYDRSSSTLRRAYRRTAMIAQQTGKKTVITEFGRLGGAIPISEILYCLEPSLEIGELLLTVLSMSYPDEPAFEFATFYNFQFPSSHRDYKNIVYGDMNLVDWTGQDKWLDARGDDWYPSFEELQLRFATPAYHMFRMFSRCAPDKDSAVESYRVLDAGEGPFPGVGRANTTERQNVYSNLRKLIVQTDKEMIVTLLNPTKYEADNLELNLEYFANKYTFAVVRETSQTRNDEVIAEIPLKNNSISLDVAPESVTQVIFTPLRLDRIKSLRLVETTATPGTTDKLKLYETTRLRALGKVDGKEVDLTELNAVWTSSEPELVVVYQGGLVQRLRDSAKPAKIQAKTLGGAQSEEITVPPCR